MVWHCHLVTKPPAELEHAGEDNIGVFTKTGVPGYMVPNMKAPLQVLLMDFKDFKVQCRGAVAQSKDRFHFQATFVAL